MLACPTGFDEKNSNTQGGEAPAPTPVPGFTLPSRYLPSFWPLFFLGTIATLHALVILLQVRCCGHRQFHSAASAWGTSVWPISSSGHACMNEW